MNFGLNESQTTLKNTVRKFLAAECPPAEVRKIIEKDNAFDAALWKKMAEQGWMGMIFPEEYGGFAMGAVEMAVALEEMGRALLPGPFLSTLTAGAVINEAGDDAQKKGYLAPICAGHAKSTLALLEDNASWSPSAISMRAVSKAGQYALNGRKLFVSDAGVADFLVVAARLDGELALFVVPKDAHGLNISAMSGMDITRKLYEVTFENVMAAPAAMLASGQHAASALDRALNIATVAICAEMVGGMQRLLEITVEYAKTRKQFGKPIGSFQAVQHQCADMLVYTESSRSAAYYAAYSITEGTPDAAAAVSVAKSYASDAYRECGNRAIQIHGGMGFTWENDCHLYYRRAKASEVTFGDALYHRERIAKLIVDQAAVRTEHAAAISIQ
jgi:alkylation response protein AidB-like acyl-CoA dehydrogenase